MTDMKKFISLVENQAAPLRGSANVQQLLAHLPEIDDPSRFVLAFNKVRRGRENTLTRPEVEQLAKAFISLMKDDRQEKVQILRHMTTLHAPDAPQQGQ